MANTKIIHLRTPTKVRSPTQVSISHQIRILQALEHIVSMEEKMGVRAADEDTDRVARAYGVTVDEIKQCRAAL